MKLTRRKIPNTKNRIALARSQANPRSRSQLESDPIAQSKAGLFLAVFPVLPGHKTGHILTFAKTVAQSAAIGAGRQASYLIHLGEILRAHCKQRIAGESSEQRESDLGRAGRNPICTSSVKPGAGPRDRER